MGGPEHHAPSRENRRPVIPGPVVRHRNRRQDDRLFRIITPAQAARNQALKSRVALKPRRALSRVGNQERMRLVHLIFSFCDWLQQTPVASYMRASFWAFPLVECLLILCGNVPLLVSTSILSARLAGWGLREVPVSKLVRGLLPWAWTGFLIQVITGLLLFSSAAATYASTRIFPLKMLLILLAGVNALIFMRTTYRRVAAWDTAEVPPLGARFAGVVSLLLWSSVLVMGRVLNSAVSLVVAGHVWFAR